MKNWKRRIESFCSCAERCDRSKVGSLKHFLTNIFLYFNLAIFGSELIAKRSGSTKSSSLIDLYEAARLEMSNEESEEDEQSLNGI